MKQTLLRMMSGAFCVASEARNFAYDHLIPSESTRAPYIISVGNIVAGGAGKTPFVQYLASRLLKTKQVAILSRGYGRVSRGPCIVERDTPYTTSGDEPLLLKRKLPGAHVIVGASRNHTAAIASDLGAEIILLDDGMQHRQMHRDCEVIVLDGDHLFGNGHFLPLGTLREHPKNLKRADHIILLGSSGEEVEKRIRSYTDAPITPMERVAALPTLVQGKRLAVFSAIARPEKFYATLIQGGGEILHAAEKPDHAPFSEEELRTIAKEGKMRGADLLVCTEKDFVKLPKKWIDELAITPIPIALSPKNGAVIDQIGELKL